MFHPTVDFLWKFKTACGMYLMAEMTSFTIDKK